MYCLIICIVHSLLITTNITVALPETIILSLKEVIWCTVSVACVCVPCTKYFMGNLLIRLVDVGKMLHGGDAND